MRILRLLLVVGPLLCLISHDALAASRQAREKAAKKACLTGDPAKGVEILADLFIETNDLAFIFNQGRCFEQNRRYEDAIGRFREFLIKGPKMKADEKAEAERHIAACESYLAKTASAGPAAQEPPKVVAVAPPPEMSLREVAPEPAGVVTVSPRPQNIQSNDGGGLRIVGLLAGGLGVACVVTGLVLNLKANSMAGDLEKPESYSRSTDSTRKDYKTFAWVGYGVGAAFVAGGVIMYYLGWRKGEAPASVAVVPVASTNMVGTMLTGAF